jgi:DNA repair exonuclease SbcCD ATPase subunit
MADPTPMLLAEAAELLGMSVNALRHRIRRGKLMGTRANDGRVLVYIDPDEPVTRPDSRPARLSAISPDGLSGHSRLADHDRADGLRAHIETLKQQLAKAEERAEREREDRERLLGEERQERAALLEHVRALIQERQQEAEQYHTEIAQLRTELELACKPWWRKVLGR